MIPKTQLVYNLVFSGVLNGNNIFFSGHQKKLDEVKHKCKQFEKLYSRHIHTILKLIEKKTGCKSWRYPFTPIHIVYVAPKYNTGWKAFSDPLTIKFIENKPDRMFYILIHELLHLNNFKGWKIEKEVEKFDEQIYEEIRKKDKSIKLTISEQIKSGEEEILKREKTYKRLNRIGKI